MSARLSWRHTAVVACRASASGDAGMTELCAAEDFGGVACFTTHLSWQMLLRLNHVATCQAQTTGMATCTVTRRAFQHTIDMARFATRGHVRPGQRKSGFQMVKFGSRVLSLQSASKAQEEKCRKHPHDINQKARGVRFHRKTPFSFVHGRLG